MSFGKGHHLHLIDGSAFIFRAYHALPPLTRKSDGLPIGAVAGFCNMLHRYIESNTGPEAPTHVAVVFDKGSHTFRNDLYDQYKANRDAMPEDLRPQMPLTRSATEAFNIACKELEGFEADDIIATLSTQAQSAGGRVTIISSDKDMMQLVGEGVEMFDAMKNRRIDRDGVWEKFGVGPERVVDVQALAGDSVDNVPGAPGIGIKTAALLINEYGDLDSLLERAGEIKQPKRRASLIDNAEQIRLSRQLVQLARDTPIDFTLDDLEVRDPDPETLLGFLAKMEFRTLTKRVSDQFKIAAPVIVETAQPNSEPNETLKIQDFTTKTYTRVSDKAELEAWVAQIYERGTVAIDTETTGLAKPIGVVELAAQRMEGWDASGPHFRMLLNQNNHISPEASRVHGYTREILERDGEQPEQVYADFRDYADGKPIISYNLAYDMDRVLLPEFERFSIEPFGLGGFCALKLAQRLLDPVPAGNCKLQTLRQFYRLPERGAHTGLGDVETVVDVKINVFQG